MAGFEFKTPTWGGIKTRPSTMNTSTTSGPATYNTRALNNGFSAANSQIGGARPAPATPAAPSMASSSTMGRASIGGTLDRPAGFKPPSAGAPQTASVTSQPSFKAPASFDPANATTERKISAASDELSEAEKSASLALNEKAAAFGGSNSGASQAAARQIMTDFAGLKNNAARDIRTGDEEAFKRDSLEREKLDDAKRARDQALEEQRAARADDNARFEKELAFKRESMKTTTQGFSPPSGQSPSRPASPGFSMPRSTPGQSGGAAPAPGQPQIGWGAGMTPPAPLTTQGSRGQLWLGGGQGFMDPNLVGSSADPRQSINQNPSRGSQAGPQVIGGGRGPLTPEDIKIQGQRKLEQGNTDLTKEQKKALGY